ncbi:hypothetical protein [Janthinobacterium fluminis]|uniref:Uncharacterized protein n=1 Tax=Janthinobacterium fluminis TaxID=2987524 RepID=A0ABT5K1N1_9BURK|nr:hypothetical protein [Janthinobacterium fluminis]MDC8758580.1 hypothetical protein [Janthinobacterium fluminis]
MNNAQKIQAGFDITNLSGNAKAVTFDVPVIVDADGEPVAGLTIVGKNSEEYRVANNAVRAEGYKKSARRKTAIDASTDEGAEQLVQAIDGNQKRLALAVVTGWYGFTHDGAPAPMDKALLEAAFDKYPTWQEKVTLALENDANFLKV